jgi:hypothetical protein
VLRPPKVAGLAFLPERNAIGMDVSAGEPDAMARARCSPRTSSPSHSGTRSTTREGGTLIPEPTPTAIGCPTRGGDGATWTSASPDLANSRPQGAVGRYATDGSP